MVDVGGAGKLAPLFYVCILNVSRATSGYNGSMRTNRKMRNLRVWGALAPLLTSVWISALTSMVMFPILGSDSARADEAYTFIVKKQEEKAKSRWSLSEWIDTRDRMRMMDLWLALHSPSPYEFYLSGAWQLAENTSGSRYNGFDFQAAGYASIFGLEIGRSSGLGTRYMGLMHFRIFGYHYQSTHIRLEGGLQQDEMSAEVKYRNAIAGVGVAIYLGKYFGIDGLFRHAFDSTPNGSGQVFAGNRYEGGAFLDFSFLRFYGKYLYENIQSQSEGPQLGLKIFF